MDSDSDSRPSTGGMLNFSNNTGPCDILGLLPPSSELSCNGDAPCLGDVLETWLEDVLVSVTPDLGSAAWIVIRECPSSEDRPDDEDVSHILELLMNRHAPNDRLL